VFVLLCVKIVAFEHAMSYHVYTNVSSFKLTMSKSFIANGNSNG